MTELFVMGFSTLTSIICRSDLHTSHCLVWRCFMIGRFPACSASTGIASAYLSAFAFHS